MEFKSIMHVAFFTDQMEEMLDFYVNKLGLKKKAVVKYGVYLNRDDRPEMQKIAKIDPERIFNIYIEIALGQFIKLFMADESQKPHTKWNSHKDLLHFFKRGISIFAGKIHFGYFKGAVSRSDYG